MQITFDNYSFPEPLPLVSIGTEPIRVNEENEWYRDVISLVGVITGSGLGDLVSQKNDMINAFSKEFAPLVIDSKTYPLAEVQSISFDDSDLTTLLPYSVELFGYEDGGSQFYGIESAKDEWSFQEGEDGSVVAVHTISAKGLKHNGQDPFVQAKNFVQSKDQGFENISSFYKDQGYYLRSMSESINSSAGEYEISYEYIFGATPIESSQAFIRYTVDLGYDVESGFSASVSGSIIGDINESPVSESYFSKEDARKAASGPLSKLMDSIDTDIPKNIGEPLSFSYTKNDLKNQIDFEFTFEVGNEDGPIQHEYTISFDEGADSGEKTASINGSIKYVGTTLPWDKKETPNPEDSARWSEVLNFYNSLSPFGMVAAHSPYKNLNQKVKSSSEDFKPFEFQIDYSFSFTANTNSILCSSVGVLEEIDYQENRPVPEIVKINGIEKSYAWVNSERKLGTKTITMSKRKENKDDKGFGGLESCIGNLAGSVCKKTKISRNDTTELKSVTVEYIY